MPTKTWKLLSQSYGRKDGIGLSIFCFIRWCHQINHNQDSPNITKWIKLGRDLYHNTLQLTAPNHLEPEIHRFLFSRAFRLVQGKLWKLVLCESISYRSFSIIFLILVTEYIDKVRNSQTQKAENNENVSNMCKNVWGCLVNMSHSFIVHWDRRDHGSSSGWYWGFSLILSFYICIFFFGFFMRLLGFNALSISS